MTDINSRPLKAYHEAAEREALETFGIIADALIARGYRISYDGRIFRLERRNSRTNKWARIGRYCMHGHEAQYRLPLWGQSGLRIDFGCLAEILRLFAAERDGTLYFNYPGERNKAKTIYPELERAAREAYLREIEKNLRNAELN